MEQTLTRNVVLGVTGGIAAYKSAFLVRELVKAGASVQVVMTPAAHDFVTPLTLATLSKRPVLTELFIRDGSGQWNDHVHLAGWADVLLIAPASANTLAKMANGICDNLLLATFLSATCPVFVAPAMDLEMYRDPSTAHNLDLLRSRGVRTIGPDSGELASGLHGTGRMTEPCAILERIVADLMPDSRLRGKRVLISAGPTQEAIDPVRYITNRSSGKMGFALAEAAAARGARVQLVSGPVAITTERPGIERVDVITAAEMAEACQARFPDCDLAIMTAAVADHRPTHTAGEKIKKGVALPVLDLEPTEDILAWMGANKKDAQLLVGFALETNDMLEHASGKLARKKADMIVANTLEDKGAGFGHDTNKVTLVWSEGADTKHLELPLLSKARVAERILDALEDRMEHAR